MLLKKVTMVTLFVDECLYETNINGSF